MKLYHYARLENLEEIKNGSWKSGGTPGIAASARLGKEGKKARKLGVGFAFFQPLPDDWFKNPEFSCPWSWLVGRALLEIEHDNENNPAYVVDRAHTLRFQVMSKNLSADEFRQRQREAENAYAESRIDAEYYLEHSDELKYVLPEVIFHDSIPLERINILEYQPMIKEYFTGRT